MYPPDEEQATALPVWAAFGDSLLMVGGNRSIAHLNIVRRDDAGGDPMKFMGVVIAAVEQPSEFDFVINMITARSLGIEIPGSVIARVTHVIE